MRTAFLLLALASGFGAGFYASVLSDMAAVPVSVPEMLGTGMVAAGFAIAGTLAVVGGVLAEKVENSARQAT